MRLVLPVLIPLHPGVGGGEDEAGDDDVEGEFAPEFCLDGEEVLVLVVQRQLVNA